LIDNCAAAAAAAAAAAVTHGVIFRQLFDASSSTYTYLVACPDTLQAALIDPVLEQVRHNCRHTR
jgi:hypothetical protein